MGPQTLWESRTNHLEETTLSSENPKDKQRVVIKGKEEEAIKENERRRNTGDKTILNKTG